MKFTALKLFLHRRFTFLPLVSSSTLEPIIEFTLQRSILAQHYCRVRLKYSIDGLAPSHQYNRQLTAIVMPKPYHNSSNRLTAAATA
jgi:hypothetical protein